jgi:hypothetical protein
MTYKNELELRSKHMNKSFLTLAAVSLFALAACGEEVNDNTTDIISSVEETTEDGVNTVATTADELSAEAEAEYQAAVDEFQTETNEIEPAAGTRTNTTTNMNNTMNYNTDADIDAEVEDYNYDATSYQNDGEIPMTERTAPQ